MQTQASPFHLSRGVIRSITLFFGWDICSSLSSSFGVLTACSAESLVQTSLSSLAQGHPESVFTATGFLIHSNCPCDGFVEVRHRGPLDLVRAPLVFVRYRACFLGGEVLGDFPGLCKILHETTLLVSYGTTWDSRRAYLSFFYLCRYRFELALLRVFVDDRSYWWTMVSVGLDLILHCWSAGTSCARVSGLGLL